MSYLLHDGKNQEKPLFTQLPPFQMTLYTVYTNYTVQFVCTVLYSTFHFFNENKTRNPKLPLSLGLA